eukprot:CAMPEP_0179008154 /NCGR_PEP_ID=MMETSP0795-20121207/15553_1 /TAXON_ID=88552 /ORGANISM="Amoebophrya sp., Strain Ameob2" /LENGTH=41 /DNA_ID= /DNA_START= /DNA_END= /DNA_ORIENTATION=
MDFSFGKSEYLAFSGVTPLTGTAPCGSVPPFGSTTVITGSP